MTDETKPSDKLLVATKSFITNDEDGKRVVVHSGRSRYRASHPIAQAFPNLFKDADTQPDVEDVRAQPGRARTRTRGGKSAQSKTED